MFASSLVRAYLMQHAATLVECALAEGAPLSEWVAVLSLPRGAPRLLPRRTAARELACEGYPSALFDVDLAFLAQHPDDLAVVGKLDGIPFADVLSAGPEGALEEQPRLAIPPFPRGPATREQIRGMAAAIEALQTDAREGIRSIGDDPRAYFVFWALFEDRPMLVARDRSRAALGGHPRWHEILPYVHTPCRDVLVLADVGGKRLVPFVDPAPEAAFGTHAT